MKKTLLFLAAASILLSFASCESKSCKCYVLNGDQYVRETDYVDESSACGSLDRYYSNGKPSRLCTEYNEPDIDPNDIGVETKKLRK